LALARIFPIMILLDYHNKIIEDTLLEKFNPTEGKFESVEIIVADFDGVTFHIFTDANSKNILYVSMSMRCYGELRKHGVDQLLKSTYGSYLVDPENGYDVSLCIDLANPPSDRAGVARNFALLKRHALAAPFYKVFADVEAKKPASNQLIELAYREGEAFYLKQETDRVIVVFAIQFKDADDVVFAKVFLQEYQDARRTMSNAP